MTESVESLAQSTILVVDDEPYNLRLLSQLLGKRGYRVYSEQDGAAALARARALLPDLILLDIMMPGLDGYTVCDRLKADERTRDIPVIFVSALDAVEHKLDGFNHGGVDYITKPIDVREVLARVSTHLTLRHLQRAYQEKNAHLQQEIADRRRAEEALRQHQEQLESLVLARTAELEREVAARQALASQLQEHAEHLEQLVDEKVRELELARGKMVQAAKLASLGEMATGVAHELNQPLTSILFDADYLRTLVRQTREGEATLPLDELHEIGEALAADVARARRITDYLRAFKDLSRGGETSVDLNRVIQDSFILTEARLRQHNIALRRDLAPDLPLIRAHPHKLEQVFFNLISNAEHAMLVMLERIQAGAAARPNYSALLEVATCRDGDGVVSTVRDNGCGMPASVRERIFEPFFTTKSSNQGAGLSLSISRDIILECGGTIDFESVENEGTTWTLRFPIEAAAQKE